MKGIAVMLNVGDTNVENLCGELRIDERLHGSLAAMLETGMPIRLGGTLVRSNTGEVSIQSIAFVPEPTEQSVK